MDKQEEVKIYISKIKGSLEHKVDSLFTLPVINPDESHGELMPSIYVDEKGNKHQFMKISHNSPQAIDCVEYGYKTWKEKNGNNNIDQWRDNIIEMLNIYTEQTRDKALKLKIGAYINLVDLFVHQEKKEKVKKEKGYGLNDDRLYALEILCPDFITHLTKLKEDGMDVEEIGQIISYITNVNPVDAYKKTFTSDKSKRRVKDDFQLKINQLKKRIDKVKG
jgi:hypothetical protein